MGMGARPTAPAEEARDMPPNDLAPTDQVAGIVTAIRFVS